MTTESLKIFTILIVDRITSPCLPVIPLMVTRLERSEIQIDDKDNVLDARCLICFGTEYDAGRVGSFNSA